MISRPVLESFTDTGNRVGGFLPGEEVAVAIIEAHLMVDPEGCVDTQILAELVQGHSSGRIVLIGRSSGNMVIGIQR